MTSNQKRSWKLQEFVAHSSNVTCLAIGPTSGRVMVSGGEDKNVNMWAIGKPNVILSLSGHATPIDCVQFNSSEELVCAGSQSGILKIWDLEAAKIVRTLSGHKANIRSLDFHPYGDFVASGSTDTTVRLWDVRRKGCILSYKGHTNSINHLRFSPDGRWVISAGEDGIVKLWDLNAGKHLADFTLHTGPVHRVEFHPRELLVATGSADRTVKFWDLETFGLISSSDVEVSSVRSIFFHPEGLCLFSGGNDYLKVYSWEPCYCIDALSLGWGRVSDMSFSSNQLVGASYQGTNISVWVTSMSGLEEAIAKTEEQEMAMLDNVTINTKGPNRKISPFRKSFGTKPKIQLVKEKQQISKDGELKGNGQPDAGLNDFNRLVDDRVSDPSSQTVFKPGTALPRYPLPLRKKSTRPMNDSGHPICRTDIQLGIQGETESYTNVESQPSSDTRLLNSIKKTEPRPPPTSNADTAPKMASRLELTTRPPCNTPQKMEPPALDQVPNEPNPKVPDIPKQYQSVVYPINPVTPPRPQPPPIPLSKVSPAVERSRQPPPPVQLPQVEERTPNNNSTPQVADKMSALNLHELSKAREPQPANDEESILVLLKRSHDALCQIMVARLQNLALVSRLWFDGNIKAAVETASSLSDLSVLVDIMNVLTQKQALWTLDLCSAVLSPLKSLFTSNYESYVETGSSSLKLIMKNFSPLIKSTLGMPPGSFGVDLVREERYQKCQGCYRHLIEIRDVLLSRTKTSGRIGIICKELAIALTVFD